MQLPHPGTGEIEDYTEQAKFDIDILEVIAEKTKGTRDPMEEPAIKDILHRLRMAFIAVTQGPN